MIRPLKLILSFFCTIAALVVISVTAYAASVNGISVSRSDLKPGDTFTVTLGVPSAAAADTASVRVEFDPNIFEVVSWNPTLTNGLSNSGSGFFVLTSANAVRAIDLSSGAEFTATLAVKKNVSAGSYSLKLVSHSFSYVADNGYEYVELWTPSVKEVSVRVTGSSGAQTTSVTTNPVTTSAPNVYAPTSSSTTKISGASVSVTSTTSKTPVVGDSDADTTSRIDINNSTPVDDDDDSYGGSSEVADGYSGGADDDTTQSASSETTEKADVSYKASLAGLPEGSIRISTRNATFDRDTEVRIVGTGKSDDNAVSALRTIGLSNHDYYAFDISLYDSATKKIAKSLTGGYIEFSVPVPEKFLSVVNDLSLYHIINGKPNLVESRVVNEDGLYRMKFRASSFSPYVIVDMVGELADSPSAHNDATYTAGNTGSGDTGSGGTDADVSVRPLNPHTGVTAAVVVPAALVGCALLSRKIVKKRKRRRNYID